MKTILLFVFTSALFASISPFTLIHWTKETVLIIQNRRNVPVENIHVTNVDPFDFDKGRGPVEQFEGAAIPARRVLERKIEINAFATKCPVTMEMQFLGGEKGSFSINMKHAIREADAEFRYEAPFNINYKTRGNNIYIIVENK